MIESIGLLGSVAGEDLVPFVDEIFPLFINAPQDPEEGDSLVVLLHRGRRE